jgi:hypothetical protein
LLLTKLGKCGIYIFAIHFLETLMARRKTFVLVVRDIGNPGSGKSCVFSGDLDLENDEVLWKEQLIFLLDQFQQEKPMRNPEIVSLTIV